MRRGHILNGMPVYHRATCIHTLTHWFSPRGSLEQPVHSQVNSRACFWEVGENQRHWRKPTQTHECLEDKTSPIGVERQCFFLHPEYIIKITSHCQTVRCTIQSVFLNSDYQEIRKITHQSRINTSVVVLDVWLRIRITYNYRSKKIHLLWTEKEMIYINTRMKHVCLLCSHIHFTHIMAYVSLDLAPCQMCWMWAHISYHKKIKK